MENNLYMTNKISIYTYVLLKQSSDDFQKEYHYD